MMAVRAIRDVLLEPRARKGAYTMSMSKMQRAIRELDRVWGVALVDAMLRTAQAIAMNETAVAESRIAEMAGHPRGAQKCTSAIRRGAAELLAIARETAYPQSVLPPAKEKR